LKTFSRIKFNCFNCENNFEKSCVHKTSREMFSTFKINKTQKNHAGAAIFEMEKLLILWTEN